MLTLPREIAVTGVELSGQTLTVKGTEATAIQGAIFLFSEEGTSKTLAEQISTSPKQAAIDLPTNLTEITIPATRRQDNPTNELTTVTPTPAEQVAYTFIVSGLDLKVALESPSEVPFSVAPPVRQPDPAQLAVDLRPLHQKQQEEPAIAGAVRVERPRDGDFIATQIGLAAKLTKEAEQLPAAQAIIRITDLTGMEAQPLTDTNRAAELKKIQIGDLIVVEESPGRTTIHAANVSIDDPNWHYVITGSQEQKPIEQRKIVVVLREKKTAVEIEILSTPQRNAETCHQVNAVLTRSDQNAITDPLGLNRVLFRVVQAIEQTDPSLGELNMQRCNRINDTDSLGSGDLVLIRTDEKPSNRVLAGTVHALTGKPDSVLVLMGPDQRPYHLGVGFGQRQTRRIGKQEYQAYEISRERILAREKKEPVTPQK